MNSVERPWWWCDVLLVTSLFIPQQQQQQLEKKNQDKSFNFGIVARALASVQTVNGLIPTYRIAVDEPRSSATGWTFILSICGISNVAAAPRISASHSPVNQFYKYMQQ